MRGLATSVIKRPLCTINGFILGILLIWLGAVLLVGETSTFGSKLFTGVSQLADLHVWGVLFLIAGACSWLRIILLSYEHVSMALHIPALLVCSAWATAFYFSPVNTGQVMYTFLVGYVLIQPFIPKLTLEFVKFAGYTVLNPVGQKERYDVHDLKCKLDALMAEMTHRGE